MSDKSYSKAKMWDAAEGGAVRCRLCAQQCLIENGATGKCVVRANRHGELFTRAAREVAAMNIDPVEKKPLFHFLPGSKTFSFGTFGCNFSCAFCQNHEMSQYCGRWRQPGQSVNAAMLVETAKKYKTASISYTYNEPTVFFELMQPCAALARDNGLRNIMVSNAYLSAETFAALDGLIDAANFDLKSFSDEFYKEYCGARLKPVLATLERAVKSGWWVELTTLIIGGLNDSKEELDSLAAYIAKELGPEVPWHVSRFHPAYKMMDRPITKTDALERALEAGYRHGLKYVYAGNVPGHDSESTICPGCGKALIHRHGFSAASGFNGACADCGTKIAGIWE